MTEPTELLPCPFCGGAPTTIERPDNIDGTQFFYAIACYCGRHSACARKMAVRKTPEIAKADAVAAWNTRTPQPTQAQAEPKSGAKSFQTYGEANAYSKGYYAGKKAATQPQAGAVPLTDNELVRRSRVGAIQTDENGKVVMWSAYYRTQMEDRFKRGWREAEKHHGIKGGQHAE